MAHILVPNWQEVVVFSPDGPQPQVLVNTPKFKVIVGGLQAGQRIPPHPEAAATYHFLTGNGWMHVDGERVAVSAGATVITMEGAVRGVEAETQLAFLAVRIA